MMVVRPRVLKRTTVYRGRGLHLVREEIDMGDRRLARETIEHPGAAVIVPLLDRRQLVMVRQYRHAVGRELLELPAGTLNPGERPVTCARRELAEETGWRARRLRRIGGFFAAPGYTDEHLTVFLAQQLERVAVHLDADEQLRPVVLSYEDALRKIRSGDICDGKSIVGILLAGRFLA